MTSDSPLSAELQFTEYVIEDGGSLAVLLTEMASSTGIYWLDFADGYSYIGQSVSVRARLATHRRRWADAVRVRFAPCLARDLDRLEVAAIRHAEALGVDLRNKLLTGRPGGGGDTVVTVREGLSLALPWDRNRRGALSGGELHTATADERARYEQLFGVTISHELLEGTAALIREAIPSPVVSQRVLWTVSALPSTGRTAAADRLMTLSVGRIEILRAHRFATSSSVSYEAWLNLVEEREEPAERIYTAMATMGYDPEEWVEFPEYRSAPDVAAVGVDVRDLPRLLTEPAVLDAVYRLVVTAMRQGAAPLGRHHNQALANELLRRAGAA